MNGKQLLIALSDIDEKYVVEAETQTPTRRLPWELAALAACGALVFFLLSPWNQPEITGDTADGGAWGAFGMMTEETIQTSKAEVQSTETGETLFIVLKISQWQDGGFTAVVQETKGAFQAGMELTVEFAASQVAGAEAAQGADAAADSAEYPVDSQVKVEIVSWDADTGTVVIASIAPAE